MVLLHSHYPCYWETYTNHSTVPSSSWFLSSHFRINIIRANLQSWAQPSKSLETPWQLGQKHAITFFLLLLPSIWLPTTILRSPNRFFNLSTAVKLLAGPGVKASWDGIVVQQPQESSVWRGLNEQS